MSNRTETTHETVDWLLGRGEKVGVLRVRLFRPFSVADFVQALPATVYAARSYLVAAITLAVGIVVLDGTVILDGTLLPPNANEWRIALFLAIFPTVLGHTPLNAALRILPASVIGLRLVALVG